MPTSTTKPLSFASYTDLKTALYARGQGEQVSLDGAVEREALSEYKARHARYSEPGVEKVAVGLREKALALVNEFLSKETPPAEVASFVLHHREYVSVAWAIAQALKAR